MEWPRLHNKTIHKYHNPLQAMSLVSSKNQHQKIPSRKELAQSIIYCISWRLEQKNITSRNLFDIRVEFHKVLQ
jgi:hypothetical protein